MIRFAILGLVGCLMGCHLPGTPAPEVCGTECADGSACEQAACGTADCEASGHFVAICPRHPKYPRLLDTIVTSKVARHRACHDLKSNCAGVDPSRDFRMGYEQAFVDVAMGADGTVPALPPASYWNSCARTESGHLHAADWFAGYAAGAPRAQAIYLPYRDVASSGVPGYESVGTGYESEGMVYGASQSNPVQLLPSVNSLWEP